MMGHKICFYGGIWIIISKLFQSPLPLIYVKISPFFVSQTYFVYINKNHLNLIILRILVYLELWAWLSKTSYVVSKQDITFSNV